MDCISTSTNQGSFIRKFIIWKNFLLALRPLEINSYSKRFQMSSKGIRVDKFSKLYFVISSFILPMVVKFVLVPMISHYQEIFRSVHNFIMDTKSCQLLVFFLFNVIIVAISFKNSKPLEDDEDFSLDEPMSVQSENDVQKQEEKTDIAYQFEPLPLLLQNVKNEKKQEIIHDNVFEIGNSFEEFNSFKPDVENCKEQEEIVTLLDNVQEGYVSDYENDSENGDSSHFGDSDNDDYSDDSSNFSDKDDDNDDLSLRAEEFIAKTNERWRAERLRE